MDTLRNPTGPLPTGTYWRRRIVVIGVLIVVLAGVVWACTRNSDAQQKPVSASSSSSSSSQGLPTVPEETQSPDPSQSATSTASGTPSGSESASKSGSPSLSKKNGKKICPADDVRVSVRTNKKFYSSGEKPKFTVIVVNLRKATCYVDIGKASAALKVISGKDRVWSNADCSDRKSEHLRKFTSGDVYTSTTTWKRNRSAKGCHDTKSDASPGYYVVEANVGKSKPKDRPVFVLRK